MSLIGCGWSYELNLLTRSLEQMWLEAIGKCQGELGTAFIDLGNFRLLSCWYSPMGLLTIRVIPKT